MPDRSDIAARTVRDHRLGPYARTGRRLVVDRIRPGDDHATLIIAGPDGEMADVEISADDASVIGAHLVIAGSFLRSAARVDADDRTPGPGDVPLAEEA